MSAWFKLSNRFSSCWKCYIKNKPNVFICTNCSLLQHIPEELSYFQIFDIQENYDIDIDLLKNNYKKLMHNFHPDKYSNSKDQYEIAVKNCKKFVESYKTLENSVSRAEYLLLLNCGRFEDSTKENKNELFELFELGEKIDETSNNDELNNLKKQLTNEVSGLHGSLTLFFHQENFLKIKSCLNRLKFLNRLIDTINKKIETIQ